MSNKINLLKYILRSYFLSICLSSVIIASDINNNVDQVEYNKIKPSCNLRAGYQYINGVSKYGRPISKASIIIPFVQINRNIGLFSLNLLNSWSLSKDSIDASLFKSWRLSLGGRKRIYNKSFFGVALALDLSSNPPSPDIGLLSGINISGEYCINNKYKFSLYGNVYGNEKGEINSGIYKITPNMGGTFYTIIMGRLLKTSMGKRFGDKVAVPVAVKPGNDKYKQFIASPWWLRIELMIFKIFNLITINIDIEHNNLFSTNKDNTDDNKIKRWFKWIQIGGDIKIEFIGKVKNNGLIGDDFEFCPSIGYTKKSEENNNKTTKFKLEKNILDLTINNDTATLEYQVEVDGNKKGLLILNNAYVTSIDDKQTIKQEKVVETQNNEINGKQDIRLSDSISADISTVDIMPAATIQLYKDKENMSKDNLVGEKDIYVGHYKEVPGNSIKIKEINISNSDIQIDFPNKKALNIQESAVLFTEIQLSKDNNKIKLPSEGWKKSITLRSQDWKLDKSINDTITYWIEKSKNENSQNKYILSLGLKEGSEDYLKEIEKYKYQIKLHPDDDPYTVSVHYINLFEISKNIIVSSENTTTVIFQSKINEGQTPVLVLSNAYLANMSNSQGTVIQEKVLEVKDNQIDSKEDITFNKQKVTEYAGVNIIPTAALQLYKDKDNRIKKNLIGENDIYIGNYEGIDGNTISIEEVDFNNEVIPKQYKSGRKLGINIKPSFYSIIKLNSSDETLLPSENKLLSASLKSTGWELDKSINDTITYWIEKSQNEDNQNKYILFLGIKEGSEDVFEEIGKYKYQIKLHPDDDPYNIAIHYIDLFEIRKNILGSSENITTIKFQSEINEGQTPVLVLSNAYLANMSGSLGTIVQEKVLEVKDKKIHSEQDITFNTQKVTEYAGVNIIPAATLQLYKDKANRIKENLIGESDIYIGNYEGIDGNTINFEELKYDQDQIPTEYINRDKLDIKAKPRFYSIIGLLTRDETLLPSENKLLSASLKSIDWELDKSINDTITYWIEKPKNVDNKLIYVLFLLEKEGSEDVVEKIEKYKYQIKLHPDNVYYPIKIHYIDLLEISKNILDSINSTIIAKFQSEIEEGQEPVLVLSNAYLVNMSGSQGTIIQEKVLEVKDNIIHAEQDITFDPQKIIEYAGINIIPAATLRLYKYKNNILKIGECDIYNGNYEGIDGSTINVQEIEPNNNAIPTEYINGSKLGINTKPSFCSVIELSAIDETLLPSENKLLSVILKSVDWKLDRSISETIIYWIEKSKGEDNKNKYVLFLGIKEGLEYYEDKIGKYKYQIKFHPDDDPATIEIHYIDFLEISKNILGSSSNTIIAKFQSEIKGGQTPILVLSNAYLADIDNSQGTTIKEKVLETKGNKIQAKQYITFNTQKMAEYAGVNIIPAATLQIYKDKSNRTKENLIGESDIYIGDYENIDGNTISIKGVECDNNKIPTEYINGFKLDINAKPRFYSVIELSASDNTLLPSVNKLLSVSLKSIDWKLDKSINDTITYWLEKFTDEENKNKYVLYLVIKDDISTSDKNKIVGYKYQIKLHPNADPITITIHHTMITFFGDNYKMIPFSDGENIKYEIAGFIPSDIKLYTIEQSLPGVVSTIKKQDQKNIKNNNEIELDSNEILDGVVDVMTTSVVNNVNDANILPCYTIEAFGGITLKENNDEIISRRFIGSKKIFFGNYTNMTKDHIKIELLTSEEDISNRFFNKFSLGINSPIYYYCPIKLNSVNEEILPTSERLMSILLDSSDWNLEKTINETFIYWFEKLVFDEDYNNIDKQHKYVLFITARDKISDEQIKKIFSFHYNLKIHPDIAPTPISITNSKIKLDCVNSIVPLFKGTINKFNIKGNINKNYITILMNGLFAQTIDIQGNEQESINPVDVYGTEFMKDAEIVPNKDRKIDIDINLTISEFADKISDIKLLGACFLCVSEENNYNYYIESNCIFFGDYTDIEKDTIKIEVLSFEKEKLPTEFPNKEKLGLTNSNILWWAPFQLKADDDRLLPSETRIMTIAMNIIQYTDVSLNLATCYWFESLGDNKYAVLVTIMPSSNKNSNKKGFNLKENSNDDLKVKLKIHPNAIPTCMTLKYC